MRRCFDLFSRYVSSKRHWKVCSFLHPPTYPTASVPPKCRLHRLRRLCFKIFMIASLWFCFKIYGFARGINYTERSERYHARLFQPCYAFPSRVVFRCGAPCVLRHAALCYNMRCNVCSSVLFVSCALACSAAEQCGCHVVSNHFHVAVVQELVPDS
jgi:hypothetical protein